MQLQFSTACLPRAPLQTSFATARSLGMGSIELALTPTLLRRGAGRIARRAEQHELVVRSLDLSPLGDAAFDRQLVQPLADFARVLPGCEVVALPTPNARRVTTGGLNNYLSLLGAYGEALGDRATLTLINSPGGHAAAPGPLDRFPQLRRIVEEWDLGYTFDTSHAASAGWVITEPLPSMGARLRNIHLNDFRQQPGLDQHDPTSFIPAGVGAWQLGRAPGEGVLPLRAFLRVLRRREYAGLVTLALREVGLRAWWSPRLSGRLVAASGFCRAALEGYHPRQALPDYPTFGPPGASAETENEGRRA
ncbi:MAG TPA: TIM barrel protein [Thermomicrobiales bacterium]|jgi:sugar phosphate isomerase/epimerase